MLAQQWPCRLKAPADPLTTTKSEASPARCASCSPSGMQTGWRVLSLSSTFRPRLQRRPSAAAKETLANERQRMVRILVRMDLLHLWLATATSYTWLEGKSRWFTLAVQVFTERGLDRQELTLIQSIGKCNMGDNPWSKAKSNMCGAHRRHTEELTHRACILGSAQRRRCSCLGSRRCCKAAPSDSSSPSPVAGAGRRGRCTAA